MRAGIGILRWVVRSLCIVLLVISGTTLLVRIAPGYLSDVREMDPRFASVTREELSVEAGRSRSPVRMMVNEISAWARGNAGISRQYGVPVFELIRPRLAVTGSLLLRSLGISWIVAIGGSLLSSATRKPWLLWQVPSTLLLAVPTAAMATVCLVVGAGGPLLVMALVLAARDFKFLHRSLRSVWQEPFVLHARSQGLSVARILVAHILPRIASQLGALASLSIVTALSAIVPVEVVFNVPGLGQLAWNAAMNRDLPVLLCETMMMAIAVTVAGMTRVQPGYWKSA
jgi:peptide/nickel transport system permease protein